MKRPGQSDRLSFAVLLAALLPGIFAATDAAEIAEPILEERIDLYDPESFAFQGSESQWFTKDGLRLRLINQDAAGNTTLLFILLHDDQRRESRAIYFEDGSTLPARELFTYLDEGRIRRTRYIGEQGQSQGYVDSTLDNRGRETGKRYFRDSGEQWAEEEIPYDSDGNKLGWTFRYLKREGGALFEYAYLHFDSTGRWLRRLRSRDGKPERLEVRTLIAADGYALQTPTIFAQGSVSTEHSEASPSFAADGRTMVFARYSDDWTSKTAMIAYRAEKGWHTRPLEFGSIYNVAISPDGQRIYYSTRKNDERQLFMVNRDGEKWSEPENLSERRGIVGTYPCETEDGGLFFYDADGPDGNGIYVAPADGSRTKAVYVPDTAPPFDACPVGPSSGMLVTRCFDDSCMSGDQNGIWQVIKTADGAIEERKLPGLPYAWGAQTVDALGLLVFTDGEDILALPLRHSGIHNER